MKLNGKIVHWLLSLQGVISFTQALSANKSNISTTLVTAQGLDSIWDYSDSDTKVQGISLGGWFLLEPYITPSLFEQFGSDESKIPVDEYHFCETLGETEAKKQLEEHWKSYYTKDDFEDIKNYGFNLVRIPVGYWAFYLLDDDPYVQGQEKYLDEALDWAREYGLKVWIDLHGVPGSQNGFDNSGKRGSVDWQDTSENIDVTHEALNHIFEKYGGSDLSDVVTGIEIVNEPLSGKLNVTDLKQFYYESYYNYRVEKESENYFAIHDAFLPIGYWNDHFNNKHMNISEEFTDEVSSDYFSGVVVDHHHYEVFTVDQLKKSSDTRVEDIINYASAIGDEQDYHPSLIGEFSAAITDCARWLNGVGTGSRYDGTFDESQLIANSPDDNSDEKYTTAIGECKNFLEGDLDSDEKKAVRKFIEVQLIEYEKKSAGWIFWNYKTEDAIEWDFKKLTKKGLFPQPFNDYRYFFDNGTEVYENSGARSSRLGATLAVAASLLIGSSFL